MEIIKEKLREKGTILLLEYICENCERPFWVVHQVDQLTCPFCRKIAFLNGNIELLREKNEKKKKKI